jgi:hypothetical protein
MKNNEIQHLNLGDIMYDNSYMIRQLNSHTVSRYAQNMEAGAKFPPLVLTQSKKLVCGFHRYEAYIKTFNLDYSIPVIIKNYKSDKEIFEDAIQDNAKNGLPLTKFEIRQAIYKCKNFNISYDRIAKLLNLKPENIQKWGDETVVVIDTRGKTEELPKKGKDNTYKFENNTTTTKVYEEMQKNASGWNVSFHANQIINNIKWKSFELNKENINILNKLLKAIEDALSEVKNDK